MRPKTSTSIFFLLVFFGLFLHPNLVFASTLSGSASLPTDNFRIDGSGGSINFYSGNHCLSCVGLTFMGAVYISGTMSVSGSVSAPTDNFKIVGSGSSISLYSGNNHTFIGSLSVSGGTVSGTVTCNTDNWVAQGSGNQISISCSGPGGAITFTDTAVPTCQAYFSPSSIKTGESSALYWSSSSDASRLDYNCSGPIPGFGIAPVSGSAPFTFSSPGNEYCALTVTNSSGKTGSCDASLTVASAATPSCSLNWNPVGPITAPSQSTITASFTNAAKYDYSCSGIIPAGPYTDVSVPASNSVSADVSFSSSQTGTETCTVTPKNSSGTSGVSCSKSLVINSGNGVWSDWSACSVSCGGGTQTRTCSIPDDGFGPVVSACSGSSNRSCNTQACSTAAPDLVAGSISPTSITTGTTVFSTTISNTGTASTGKNFWTLFQKATSATGTNTTDLSSHRSYELAGNSSVNSLSSQTFQSSGTYYIRACADKEWSGDTGLITESNSSETGESNNCGAWTAITVSNTAITASCSVSPASGTVGTIFTWSVSVLGTGSYTYSWSGTDGLSGTGTSVQKSYSTSGTKTGSVAVTSGGNLQTFICYSSAGSGGAGGITVTAPTASDLTADSISPATAIAGTAATFSSTISNGGNASTGGSFTNLFQKATDSNGTGATDIGTYTQSTALAAGTTTIASLSYTLSSSGTYYIRVCADKSSSGNIGVITESNESNNCGGWIGVAVSEPPSAPTVEFSANPSTIAQGQSSKLTWSSTGATSCTGTGFSTDSSTSNSTGISVSPSRTSIYQIACSGAGGTSTKNATVTVLVPNVSIDASPKRITKGGETEISWNVSDASTCSITKNGNAWKSPTVNDEGKSFGSYTDEPSIQTIYKISCSGEEDSVTVNVTGVYKEF